MRLKIISLFVVILLLAGCKYDVPRVDSGSVELHSDGHITRGELSDFQIDALSEWLRAHRTGWEFKIADRMPELLVLLKRKGAIVAAVDIRQREITVKNLVRPISAEEHAKLSTILASFFTSGKETAKPPRRNPGSRPMSDNSFPFETPSSRPTG